MDVLYLKLIFVIVLFVLAAFFGLLPLKVLKVLRRNANQSSTENPDQLNQVVSLVLCLLTCFTGGTFLGASLLHLLSDTEENFRVLQESYGGISTYPIPELISGYGFFFVYLVEEIILIIIRRTNPALVQSHGAPGDAVTKQTLLLKRDDAHYSFRSDNTQLGSIEPRRPLAISDKHGDGHTGSFSQPSTTIIPINTVQCGHTVSAEPECCEPETNYLNTNDPPIRMAAKPHEHSHGVRSLTLLIALSFHSLIEGIAIGISKTPATTTSLFISVVFHKCIVLFSLGIQLARTHATNKKFVIIGIILLSLMSPLGTFIGLGIEEANFNTRPKLLVEFVFNGISVGTFLYVTFFEILVHERDNEHPNYQKLMVMFVGFSIMAGLRGLE